MQHRILFGFMYDVYSPTQSFIQQNEMEALGPPEGENKCWDCLKNGLKRQWLKICLRSGWSSTTTQILGSDCDRRREV